MYTHQCPNCGKEIYAAKNGKMNIFCNQQCHVEYGAKKRKAKEEKAAEQARLRATLVPETLCRKCEYGFCFWTNHYACAHFEIRDKTRLSLHPEGLSADCKEFTPRKRKRKGRGISVR